MAVKIDLHQQGQQLARLMDIQAVLTRLGQNGGGDDAAALGHHARRPLGGIIGQGDRFLARASPTSRWRDGTDSAGNSTDYTTSITVNNVAPGVAWPIFPPGWDPATLKYRNAT